MKLGLGTAQLGLDYGITNQTGRTSHQDAVRMLELSARAGFSILDTAHHYGDSESILGDIVAGDTSLRIVTKTPRFAESRITLAHADQLEQAAALSLRRLKRPKIYGLLLHHAPDALAEGSDHLFDRLAVLKRRGWIEKVGVSVYGPQQLASILDYGHIDIAQIPFNVFDQRLHAWPSLMERLQREHVELHIRSVFLQGLLLEDPERLNPYFAPLRSVLGEFRRRATEAGLSVLEMALRFAMTAPSADVTIIGACSAQQLTEIIGAADGVGPLPDLRDLAVADEALVNPSLWTLRDS